MIDTEGRYSMKVSKILLFRDKYNIPRAELSSACGISNQRLFELEMNPRNVKHSTVVRIRKGLEAVAFARSKSADALLLDLFKHRDSLLDIVEEQTYEL